MADSNGQVIEAQVDYLTVSAHGEDRAERLEDYGRHLQKGEADQGNDISPWHSMGYVGTHCGHIDTARRDNHSTILRVSGDPARVALTDALGLADNVTRLDVCVTWRAAPPDPRIGENAYSLAQMFYAAHPRAALPSNTRDAAGGFTCYLGDRRSPYYARVYNKQAERESRHDAKLASRYQDCWRYEVEAHDARAMALATSVEASEDREAFIQQFLFEWFRQRGIEPTFPETGADAIIPGLHRRTDDETRLRHLARSVAPTVRKLRARGHEEKVRAVLGFDPGAEAIRQLASILSRHRDTIPNSGPDTGPQGGDHAETS